MHVLRCPVCLVNCSFDCILWMTASGSKDIQHSKWKQRHTAQQVEAKTYSTASGSKDIHSPWANLKKASGSWLLFQIERAKVWSSWWVENDKRKSFGGVVVNCGVQTLSKNRFFVSVRQGRRRGRGWHRGCRSLCDLPQTSLRFAADVGHGLDGRAC